MSEEFPDDGFSKLCFRCYQPILPDEPAAVLSWADYREPFHADSPAWDCMRKWDEDGGFPFPERLKSKRQTNK